MKGESLDTHILDFTLGPHPVPDTPLGSPEHICPGRGRTGSRGLVWAAGQGSPHQGHQFLGTWSPWRQPAMSPLQSRGWLSSTTAPEPHRGCTGGGYLQSTRASVGSLVPGRCALMGCQCVCWPGTYSSSWGFPSVFAGSDRTRIQILLNQTLGVPSSPAPPLP